MDMAANPHAKYSQGVSDSLAVLPLLSRYSRVLLLTTIVVGVLAAIAMIILAILRWNFALSHFGPGVVGRWAALPLLTAAILLGTAFAALMYLTLRRHAFVRVGQSGLTYEIGRRRRHYPWSELCDLTQSVVRYGLPFWRWGTRSSLGVSTTSGRTLKFHGALHELEPFIHAIKQNLYPRRLQDYRDALAQRERLVFGPLECSAKALVYRKKMYSWDQVRSVDLEGGHLHVGLVTNSGNKRLQIPTSRIPNPDLCAQLLKNIEY